MVYLALVYVALLGFSIVFDIFDKNDDWYGLFKNY